MKRHGIVVTDAIVGLAIIAVLGTVLAVAVNRGHVASAKLAQQRGTTWAAENVLTTLQSGKSSEMPGITIEPLAQDGAPAGHVWVRVRAQHDGRTATLIGMVPTSALPAAGRQP